MDIVTTLLTIIISALTGGILREVLTAKASKKKAEVEASELISNYHRSEIEQLIKRIDDLQAEVKLLTLKNHELEKKLIRCSNCTANEGK